MESVSTVWYSGADYPPGLMVELRGTGDGVCDQVRKAEIDQRETTQLKKIVADQRREIRALHTKLDLAHARIRALEGKRDAAA